VNLNKISSESTAKYIAENEYIDSLERLYAKDRRKKFHPDSILWMLKQKLLSLKGILVFGVEVIIGWHDLYDVYKLKNSKCKKIAILIGNGPSQGYIDEDLLLIFKKNGGEIFSVNYWTENDSLSKCVPNYLAISDPLVLANSASELVEKNNKLKKYILENDGLKLICPVRSSYKFSNIFGNGKCIVFSDVELRAWTSNISPLFPRGYASMTLYKALAMALWFGYEKIYIIGMDNTYPRNIYCDIDNRFLNLEIHSGSKDYVVDQSSRYSTIADGIYEISIVFRDLVKVSNDKIVNLDRYSLTDAFRKASNQEIMELNLFKKIK